MNEREKSCLCDGGDNNIMVMVQKVEYMVLDENKYVFSRC